MREEFNEACRDARFLLSREYVPQAPWWYRCRPSNLLRLVSLCTTWAGERCRRLERRLLTRRPGTDGPLRLHLGCGVKRIDGFINIDAFMSDAADRAMNILDLAFPENSVDEIYSSHMLEHLAPRELDMALQNWFSVLRPGGRLSVRVPDFRRAIEEMAARGEPQCWDAMGTIYGPQRDPSVHHTHRNGFSAERLRAILESHGFVVEEAAPCGTRYGGETGDVFCQAVKPDPPVANV